jgi:hypothetical protein
MPNGLGTQSQPRTISAKAWVLAILNLQKNENITANIADKKSCVLFERLNRKKKQTPGYGPQTFNTFRAKLLEPLLCTDENIRGR